MFARTHRGLRVASCVPLLAAGAVAVTSSASTAATKSPKPPPPTYQPGQRCTPSLESTYLRLHLTCYKHHLYTHFQKGYYKAGLPCTPKQELVYEANGFKCVKHKLKRLK